MTTKLKKYNQTPIQLWIVGKCCDWRISSWEFQGVYDSEAAAAKACVDDRYFIGPATLNKRIPNRTTPWPGSKYPKLS